MKGTSLAWILYILIYLFSMTNHPRDHMALATETVNLALIATRSSLSLSLVYGTLIAVPPGARNAFVSAKKKNTGQTIMELKKGLLHGHVRTFTALITIPTK